MLKDYLIENQPLFYRIILNEFQQNKIPHAYLLSGKNVEKPLEFLKMSLICDETLACETCLDCQKVKNHQYTDIIEVNGYEEIIKKAHIENIQSTFKKSSLEGKYKIYIIERIENATKEAMNSLLKMLEEPTEGIYAIFTTQNINKVLPTIISRCQVIEIKLDNRNILKKELLEEGVEIEKANILSILMNDKDRILELDENNFDDIKVEVLNFVEDLFLHRENLIINTQIHLMKNHSNKEDIKLFLNILIIALKDMFHVKHNKDIAFINHIEMFQSFQYDNDDLIKKIELVLETLNLVDSNANLPLLLDSMMYRL